MLVKCAGRVSSIIYYIINLKIVHYFWAFLLFKFTHILIVEMTILQLNSKTITSPQKPQLPVLRQTRNLLFKLSYHY